MSGEEHSAIADLKRDLEDVANFKCSRAEAWLMMYCKQTQTPYNKLSEEEKHWLMRIAQKSKLAKSHVSQRGKTEVVPPKAGIEKGIKDCERKFIHPNQRNQLNDKSCL